MQWKIPENQRVKFLYTGSTQSNDVLKIQVKTAFGGWYDLQVSVVQSMPILLMDKAINIYR